jgi:hypothetical protein
VRVFENNVSKRIMEPKRDEIIGGWRKLHMMSFMISNIIRIIKPRRKVYPRHTARIEANMS